MSDLGIEPPRAPSAKGHKKGFFSKLFKKKDEDSKTDLPNIDEEISDYNLSKSLDDKAFDLADIEKKVASAVENSLVEDSSVDNSAINNSAIESNSVSKKGLVDKKESEQKSSSINNIDNFDNLPEIPEPNTDEKDIHEMINSTLKEPSPDVLEKPDFDYSKDLTEDQSNNLDKKSFVDEEKSDFTKDPEDSPSFSQPEKENDNKLDELDNKFDNKFDDKLGEKTIGEVDEIAVNEFDKDFNDEKLNDQKELENLNEKSEFTKEIDDASLTTDKEKEDSEWTSEDESKITQKDDRDSLNSEFTKEVPISSEDEKSKNKKQSEWLKEEPFFNKETINEQATPNEEATPQVNEAPKEIVDQATADLKPLIDEHESLKEEIEKLSKKSKLDLPDKDHPFEKPTEKDKTFFVRDGTELKSIKDLIRALNVMDDETFRHHVNEHRNDFSNWVKHVFKEDKLAEDMLKAKDKFELLDVLYDHSNEHEQNISKKINKVKETKEDLQKHLEEVEGLHEQLEAMKLTLNDKYKEITDNHKEIEDKVHKKVKEIVNKHLKAHHDNLKKELNKTQKERERIIKNAKKLDERIRAHHQQTKEELEKQKQLILKERTEAFKLKAEQKKQLDKLQKEYSNLKKKLEASYSKEQSQLQKKYENEEKKLNKKYSKMFEKLQVDKDKFDLKQKEAQEILKEATKIKRLKIINQKELAKLSELRKKLDKQQSDLEKQAVYLKEKSKSLGEQENSLAKKEVELNKKEYQLAKDKEEFVHKMAVQEKESQAKINSLYAEYEKMAKSRDEDFIKRTQEKENLLNNWEKELKAKQDSFDNEFKLFKSEESKFKNYVKRQNAAIEKKKNTLKKEMKKLDKMLADKAQVAKYIEEVEQAVHKHEVTNYLGEKLQEIKYSNAQQLLENADVSDSVEIYAMIDECKSFLNKGNLKSAKALYNKIRSEYSKADLAESEKDVLYDSIRELYEEIQISA